MKQHIENQIKNAFDNWENSPNDIGFDKAAVWQSIAAKNQVSKFNWMKIAAIIFIFFLTGALAFTIHENQSLQEQNEVLKQKISTQTEKIIFHTDTIVKLEVQYQTVEKLIDNPQHTKLLKSLSYQNQLLTKKNLSLQKEIENHIQEKFLMIKQDDIAITEAAKITQKEEMRDKPKASQQLQININKEALMAISKRDQNFKSNHPVNGKKLIFSITSKPDIPETSAPIFRNIHQ